MGRLKIWNGSEWDYVNVGADGASGVLPFVHLRNQQNSGTDGGTSIADTWTTAVLNTEVHDADGICSLSTNLFTLSSGTYEVFAAQSILESNVARIRIRNTTDNTTVIVGRNAYGRASFGVSPNSNEIFGRFTVAASKALALQYYVDNAQATNGLGAALAGSGEVEVYADVLLWKVA